MKEYTQKEMFEVVKYFKYIYTLINNNTVERIYFDGLRFFYKKDQFFILYGELEELEDNTFIEWIKGKNLTLDLVYIDNLKKEAVKKNLESMEITEDYLKIKYLDREGNDAEFLCSNVKNTNYNDIIQSVTTIKNSFTGSYELNFDNFEDTILLYLKDGEVTDTASNEKLIDFPIKRILSNQSLSKQVKKYLKLDEELDHVTSLMNYSNRDAYGKRFIEIISKSPIIKINQIFATI